MQRDVNPDQTQPAVLPDIKYALMFPNFGPYSDASLMADLAAEAENAGWDGVFVTDIIQMEGYEDSPSADPWITLSAIAMTTERIRIGPRVTAPPRMRPWQLARQAASLDQLSNGRLILGVGIGDEHDRGFSVFGEEMDMKARAGMLDESLAILEGLWSGEPFSFEGEHYQFDEITLLPRPVQQPRVPIWAGWVWPNQRPMRRAVGWDGASPGVINEDGSYGEMTPDGVRRLREYASARRGPDESFDIIVDADLFDAPEHEAIRRRIHDYAEAGATWCAQFLLPEFHPDHVRSAIWEAAPVRESAAVTVTVI